MELTEEQLKQIVTNAIAENNKTLITKEEAKHILKVMKDDIPQTDTSKFATKDALAGVTTSLNEKIEGIVTDVKKVITKVFPDQTPKQKSSWFVFD